MSSQTSFSIEKFHHQLSKQLIDIINIILKKGFSLTLVGGCVRDFLLTGALSNDFDFEIRSIGIKKIPDFLKEYEALIKYLTDDLKAIVEPLSFSIYRVTINKYEIEISVPRIDKYQTLERPKKHSEFEVTLDPAMDYKYSFLRRDFTINSMGVLFEKSCEIENMSFIDPFFGEKDLYSKTLKSQNPDFPLDPVRMLRMLRFKTKFDLSLDSSLSISRFNLQRLTFYYIESEFNKLKDRLFLKSFWSTIDDYQIAIKEEHNELSFFKDITIESGLSLKEVIIHLFKESKITEEKFLKLTYLFAWKKKPMLEIVKQIK